uniref:Uncharacterized protein n=1 Tax=Mycena chlorophos TaxID=658473 RepID=A0ABQ0M3A0_MYCCL|nr:predicted protein [Mycena chlorophos]
MEAQPPSLPRLRLSRQPLAGVASRNDEPDAGPSRQQSALDDTQPTPRNPHTDDSAERLRATLKREKMAAATRRSPTSTDNESDFDPPLFSPPQQPNSMQSIRNIFSRALDTPPTKRARRGSTSEVEDGSTLERHKGKRKSLSDEEADVSKTTSRSSQATTYNTLRARLDNSTTQLKDQPPPATLHDTFNADDSGGTDLFMRGLQSLGATDPLATSTPPHSLEISQNSRYQSNLLDHDSEMHHLMDMDSYEGQSGPSGRPLSFPSSHGTSRTPRPGSSTSNTDRKSFHGSTPVSRARTHSGHESHDSPDHLHDLERKWNQHHAKPAEKLHTHSSAHAPNGHARARTHSSASVFSVDGDSSSRATSTTSHSDHKEQMHELELEKNHEREQGWNKHHSNSSLHPPTERVRKFSNPSRPGSSQSIHPPSHSRTHSTASSNASETSDEEERVHHEIDHERERNWNAPHPKWGKHPMPAHQHPHRSPSPLPPSPAASSSRKRVDSSTIRGTPKAASSSLSTSRTSPAPTPSSKTTPNTSNAARHARTKSLVAPARPMSYPARPHSPLPPIQTSTKSPGLSPTVPLSPERERVRPRLLSTPSPVASKRPPNAGNRHSFSQIPVPSRTPNKTPGKAPLNGHVHKVFVDSPREMEPAPRVHEDSDAHVTEEDSTPVTVPAALPEQPPSRSESPPAEQPLRRPARSPSPRRVVQTPEDVQFQKALATAPPPSPPPSPPTPVAVPAPRIEVQDAERTSVMSLLSTPPKRPSFHNSKLDFRTPSPPKGLPDLPGPPSSDEETETEAVPTTPFRFPDMTMKTPRPPGAWSNTPVRDSSPPPSESDSQYEGGLATPGPSLSRGSTLPMQTPRPPGGWVPTPAQNPMRRSVLQVRFNEGPSELELSATEESTNGHPEEQSSDAGLPTPSEEEESFQSRTPDPVAATISPIKSPRRSPTKVNIVDAFGRSPKHTPRSSPKNRKKIRVVDAMGNEVKAEASVGDESMNGVSEMASKLEEMDLSSDLLEVDRERIARLDDESRAARAARDKLEEAYRRQTAQLHALRSYLQVKTEHKAQSSSPRIWLWTIIIMFQALFIFLLYRYQAGKTHELFLTTYYDPLYPDLQHIYGTKYDYLAVPGTITSLSSLSNTFWEEGPRAFLSSLLDTGALLISEWQRAAWRRWGAEDISWPPT